MDVQWIKLSTGIFLNPKMVQLRSLKGGDRISLIWIMLLVLAGRSNRGGRLMLTDDIPYDFKMLSRELGYSPKTLELSFGEFVRLNMTYQDNGVWVIKNWEKYQNVEGMDKIREQNRARKRAQRSRDRHVTVTQCHATEEEKELETEKEFIHSFCQPQHSEFVENRKRSFLGGEIGGGVVLLSEEQIDDLLNRLSVEEFDKYVSVVRDMELCGKHYKRKTHYQAIIDMANKDRGLNE
ncbi:MAG: phage replisome organizer N-terminal domain-containing protein [Oscillospiraceae bacterium]|nr:phage replisome organizer N-terminal domain-containing protein [Oscillospiraceae bacterium]